LWLLSFYAEQRQLLRDQKPLPMARTIKLYRIDADGRHLAAGAIRASSQDDLPAHWHLFLATATQGLYIATYRGLRLGTAMVTEAGEPMPIALAA
jgi:hypothetical protein